MISRCVYNILVCVPLSKCICVLGKCDLHVISPSLSPQDSWESLMGIILYYADNQDVFGPFAGPGQWNDPDQLIIGDFGLSLDQQMTQMAMWAIYASVNWTTHPFMGLCPVIR